MSDGGRKRALKVLYQFLCSALCLSLRKLKEQRDSGSRDFKKRQVWGRREGLDIWYVSFGLVETGGNERDVALVLPLLEGG